MSTKSHEQLTSILENVLSKSLPEKKSRDTVLSNWQAQKAQVSKLLSSSESSVKTTKKAKDPNAPKKQRSAYIIFCSANRDNVKQLHPGLSNTEVTSMLGKMWKAITPDDKKHYESLAAQDKDRYNSEMSTYTPPADLEVKAPRTRGAKKERTGPKRAQSAYMYFCADRRESVKAEGHTGSAIMKRLGELWRELSEDEKAPYAEQAAQDKSRYESEKASGVESSPAVSLPVPPPPPAAPRRVPAPPTFTAPTFAASKTPTPPTLNVPSSVPAQQDLPTARRVAPSKPQEKKLAPSNVQMNTPGYARFLEETTEALVSLHPGWNNNKVLLEVNKQWKELSNEERAAYEEDTELEQDE